MMSTYYIISTTWALIAVILLLVSWRLARQGKISVHKNLMGLLTLGAWIFVINYLFRQRYGGAQLTIPKEYILWMAIHGSLGLIPLLGATSLIIARFRAGTKGISGHFNRLHKGYGRVFIVIWIFTHLGGIVNALILN